MSKIQNLLAGLGGAIALNLLHESLKKKSQTPRIDLLGEEALQKTLEPFDAQIEDKDNLYAATLGADVVSNTIYYSMIGAGGKTNLWPRAILSGLTAGIGAISLPEKMGLDQDKVANTNQKAALTVGYYVFGALVTAGILQLTSRK